MSNIEKVYLKFKQRNDKIKTIDGKQYYRIVYSDFINIEGREKGLLSVIPSPDMPKNYNETYIDEKGNHFIFKGVQHLRFVGDKVPEWYTKCRVCTVDWQETKNIGKYLTIEEKNIEKLCL